MSDQHPCFSCALPDCDETLRGCNLKKALREYASYKRTRTPAPDDVVRAYSIAHAELYTTEHNARCSEKKLQEAAI